jgi:H+/Cl- antiporter ClcA
MDPVVVSSVRSELACIVSVFVGLLGYLVLRLINKKKSIFLRKVVDDMKSDIIK